MSRPIRFIGYATPTKYGRVCCLSISNQFRSHVYYIISKWKDIVINKNHLFTSHWSLFPLLYSLEKPPCSSFLCRFRESSRITDYHFTVIGLYLPEEVFSHESLVDKFAFGGKIGKAGLEPATHSRLVYWLVHAALPVKLHTYNRHLTVSTRVYRAMRDTNTEPFYTPLQILCGTRRNRAHTFLMSLYTAFGWAVG